jgi:putative dehydrogenase
LLSSWKTDRPGIRYRYVEDAGVDFAAKVNSELCNAIKIKKVWEGLTVAPVVAVVAMGEMGAGLARVMVQQNARVRTMLRGRSEASVARAQEAGVELVDSERELLSGADFFLSIVPPGVAKETASHYAPVLRELDRKPIYVDCNAVSPQTVQDIGEIITASEAEFVDACLLGVAPGIGRSMPRLFVSGAAAQKLQQLAPYGLPSHVLSGDVGQASALKCAYAALGKGLTAIAAWSILGAERYGVTDVFTREVVKYQPGLAAALTKLLPDMFPKAYRWVAEMQEIGGFLNAVPGGAAGFESVSQFFQQIAIAAESQDAAHREMTTVVEEFLRAASNETSSGS